MEHAMVIVSPLRRSVPGLSKDIQCHVRLCSLLHLQIIRSDIRPHMKWAVSLVIADGDLISLRFFFVCIYMSKLIIIPLTCSSVLMS